MRIVAANIDGKAISGGASPRGKLSFRDLAFGWSAMVQRWWLDYCTREGLRGAPEHIVLEAGYRRTPAGRIVELAPRRSVHRPQQ